MFKNQNRIIATLLCIALSMSFVNAFKTYTEKVNPFNKFLNPVEGVDLYSGNVAFTKTLYEMRGRNDLNISIDLKYSSNVYLNARVSNEKAPTGWLGLGWNLSYGSIRRTHRGTVDKKDDLYYWVSPEGYEKQIKAKYDIDVNAPYVIIHKPIFYIEDYPYIYVECHFDGGDANYNNEITGWTLTKPDGKKLHYGDWNFTDSRKATRYTFAVGEYVEPPISQVSKDNIILFPYQWDLADIEDNFQNHIRFEYQQDQEKVKSFNWNDYTTNPTPLVEWNTGTTFYTKASYIKNITNQENEQIEFGITPTKQEDEYYDPHRFTISADPDALNGQEPDAFIEIIEKHLLSQ